MIGPTARVLISLLAAALPAIGSLGARTAGSAQSDAIYELVVQNGRVIDPASGLDAVRSIGIAAGKILIVTDQPLNGRETLDASGLVVAPGFVDVHQHAHDPAAYAVEVLGGTTTALELEEGTADVDRWYETRSGGSLINHGVSASHTRIRMRVMGDPGRDAPIGPARSRAATEAELTAMATHINESLRQGAVAVGVMIHTETRPWEILEVFRAAAAHRASVHVHLRSLEEPFYFLETEEVIAAAAATGAAAHVVHIQSSGGEDTGRMLELIGGARTRGIDVSAEVYPYTASMTSMSAYDDWESWPDAKFSRFEWPVSGERLTKGTFAKYHKQGGLVVDHNNTEAIVTAAVAHPLTMIASDGVLANGIGHPRVGGTFARVLGRYVREQRVLTLMDALRKMTVEPAQRLVARVPAMAAKGRIQAGADAQLVVFDAARIIDRATYREPTLPAEGIRDVLVNGVIVVRTAQCNRECSPDERFAPASADEA